MYFPGTVLWSLEGGIGFSKLQRILKPFRRGGEFRSIKKEIRGTPKRSVKRKKKSKSSFWRGTMYVSLFPILTRAQLRRRSSDLEAERPPLSPIAHDEQYSYISTKEQKRWNKNLIVTASLSFQTKFSPSSLYPCLRRSLEFVNRQQDTENNVTCRRKRKTETASGHSIRQDDQKWGQLTM